MCIITAETLALRAWRVWRGGWRLAKARVSKWPAGNAGIPGERRLCVQNLRGISSVCIGVGEAKCIAREQQLASAEWPCVGGAAGMARKYVAGLRRGRASAAAASGAIT